MTSPFRILERKRSGARLSDAEIREVVRGATDGSWSEVQLAAFLMAAAIRGLDDGETEALTLAMLDSGERWDLAAEVPALVDKHSTGGVGDKVSLLLSPLLAACGRPVVMLTGRGLGHTGGTADKLESIPGVTLALDRPRTLAALREAGLAIGIATSEVAPADRRLYAIRDQTATIDSIPLITGSILSKKLATGAAALVFDVKTGNGAFLPQPEQARDLAQRLVTTTRALGRRASALLTDMSQPLGRWVGHTAEVREVWECLGGEVGGQPPPPPPEDLLEVTFALCREVAGQVGQPLTRRELEEALASGRARERFLAWAELQGAESGWLARPRFPLAPAEHPLAAPRSGRLARVATQQIGLLLAEAGGGRARLGGDIDFGVSLHVEARLGERLEAGQELARLYLRRPDETAAARLAACFEVEDEGQAPPLILERVDP
jgi:pyrimidine-nucleoside phosphorylase